MVDTQYGSERYRCWLHRDKNGVDVGIWERGNDLNEALGTAVKKAKAIDLHPECPGEEEDD
jgi:hypothetical protein